MILLCGSWTSGKDRQIFGKFAWENWLASSGIFESVFVAFEMMSILNRLKIIVIFVFPIVGFVASDSNEICSAYSGRRIYLDENGSGAIQAANVTASTLKNVRKWFRIFFVVLSVSNFSQTKSQFKNIEFQMIKSFLLRKFSRAKIVQRIVNLFLCLEISDMCQCIHTHVVVNRLTRLLHVDLHVNLVNETTKCVGHRFWSN